MLIICEIRFVGTITTTSFGFSLRKHVALGFVKNHDDNGEVQVVTSDWVRKGSYEIEIAGQRFPATVRFFPVKIIMEVNGYFTLFF